MKFLIKCVSRTNEFKDFWYDNETSGLFNADGSYLNLEYDTKQYSPHVTVSKNTPGTKVKDIKKLKIQLGLSCNYECGYCSQRFVPRADETSKLDAKEFLKNLSTWFKGGSDGKGEGVTIEFWGGEPFVYWKTLKPLAEKLRKRYPNSTFLIVTNGSLLSPEKNSWLLDMGFVVGLSHDGPGQYLRGPDPFDDKEKFDSIMDLWNKLGTIGRMSFNSMITKNNSSRLKIKKWFKDKLGFDVPIGEGGLIDPYDDDGASNCFSSSEDHLNYRKDSFYEIQSGEVSNFNTVSHKINDFIKSVVTKRPSYSVGQKCGMDKQDNIAVDLKGNVLTCQNESPVAMGLNGESHLIGHVSDFDNIQLKTSTHWSHRDDCKKCPVLQLCKGSCMFLHGPLWDLGCDNSYSDNIPYFMTAFEILTGYIPYYIDGEFREDRKDIIGSVNGIPVTKKKSFPIRVVAG